MRTHQGQSHNHCRLPCSFCRCISADWFPPCLWRDLTALTCRGVVPNNEAVVSLALGEFGQAIMRYRHGPGTLLARFRFNHIFLTTTPLTWCYARHHLCTSAAFPVGCLHSGACLLVLIMVLSLHTASQPCARLPAAIPAALGHFGGAGWFAGMVGKLFASIARIAPRISFPKPHLPRDNTVSIGLTYGSSCFGYHRRCRQPAF